MRRQNPATLSLTQQFASAAIAVSAGVAAAFAADATIGTAIQMVADAPLLMFAVNFGALFAVTGATAAYTDHALATHNRTRQNVPQRPWWNTPYNP